VQINPLLVLLSILVAASIGSWIGGLFGGFVAALLAIPAAGALQVVVAEIWQATEPQPAQSAEAPGPSDGQAEALPDEQPDSPAQPTAAPGATAGRQAATPP
jgi:hypothetical protein